MTNVDSPSLPPNFPPKQRKQLILGRVLFVQVSPIILSTERTLPKFGGSATFRGNVARHKFKRGRRKGSQVTAISNLTNLTRAITPFQTGASQRGFKGRITHGHHEKTARHGTDEIKGRTRNGQPPSPLFYSHAIDARLFFTMRILCEQSTRCAHVSQNL